MRYRKNIWYLCLMCVMASPTLVGAQTNLVEWHEGRPNFWIALHQKWGSIRFSAIKFHLGYYKVELVDVRSYRDKNLDKIRALSDNRKFSNNLLDTGIGVIFQTWPDQSNIVAVAPAGWSTSLRRIEQSGFLKIYGKELSDFDERGSLSAILCLHSPDPKFRNFEYQVPAFFQTSNPKQVAIGESCNDAVQVGPRITEDPAVEKVDQRGILPAEVRLPPQLRVVFALDDPGRSFPPDRPNNKLRENARNGYIIITETPAHLWDIQEMLLSEGFYGPAAKPHWAINMAGGGPSGLITYDTNGRDTTIIGNPSGIIGSAFVVTTRK